MNWIYFLGALFGMAFLLAYLWVRSLMQIDKMKDCQHEYKQMRVCKTCGHRQVAIEK